MSQTSGTSRVTAAWPYLVVSGAAKSLDFYRDVFGATLVGEPYVARDGRIGHSEIELGGLIIGVADEYLEYGYPAPSTLGGTSVGMNLKVGSPEDVDAMMERAIEAGSTVLQSAGPAHGQWIAKLLDPFGHRWTVAADVQ